MFKLKLSKIVLCALVLLLTSVFLVTVEDAATKKFHSPVICINQQNRPKSNDFPKCVVNS